MDINETLKQNKTRQHLTPSKGQTREINSLPSTLVNKN